MDQGLYHSVQVVAQWELDHLPLNPVGHSRSYTVKNTSTFLAFPRVIAVLKTGKTILGAGTFAQSP
jgi:hypothetical protein